MNVRRVVREYPITSCASFNGVLMVFAGAFTGPTFATFELLVTGAILLHRRHTVTNMIRAIGLHEAHHARFHRFFADARWALADLWERFAEMVVGRFCAPDDRVVVGLDDTAEKKTGGKIYGTSVVHDNRPAVHKEWAFSWGHTWVVASLLVRVSRWAGHWYALPAHMALYRSKKLCQKEKRPFRTKPQLALGLLETIVSWLPGRRVLALLDGGYAYKTPMRHLPERVDVVTRMRHDAAIYELPGPKRPGRGRPPSRGERLPRPDELVKSPACLWKKVAVGGKDYEVVSRVVLWPTVFGPRPILMVASRRPGGTAQFFATTDLSLTAAEVVAWYDARWAIEVMFREMKERMGFEEPQCRVERAVERTAPFLLLVLGLVHHWFLSQEDPTLVGRRPRWYGRKRREAPPSFSEMLAALRRATWDERFSGTSSSEAHLSEIHEALVAVASMAA